MKRRPLLASFLSLLLLLACFDSGTEPEGGSEEEQDSYTSEGSASVGASGGVLAAEGFSLAVPAGAFGADASLVLASSGEEPPFGSASGSKVYRVDGLPEDGSAPLRVAVAYEDSIEAGAAVAVGEEVYVPSTGEQVVAYRLLSATDSSGYLVAEIPAPDALPEKGFSPFAGSAGSSNRLYFLAVARSRSREAAQSLFQIRYDPNVTAMADADALITWLSQAWAEMEVLGFLPESRRTEWPVEVTIRDLGGAGRAGRFVPSAWRKNWATLEFDQSRFHDRDTIRVAAYHEIPVFVDHLYAPVRRAEVLFGLESNRLWLTEALASYVEELLTGGSAYPRGPWTALYDGVQAGAAGGAREHGRGLTPFLERLRWYPPSGSGTLGDVYARIEEGRHPIRALADIYGGWEGWYASEAEDLLFGQFPITVQDSLIRNAAEEFVLRSASDTIRTFTHDYPDLSAKLYRIRLDGAPLDENGSLNFAARGRTAGIHLFAIRPDGTHPEYDRCVPLLSSVDDLSLTDAKDHLDGTAGVLALITNSRWVEPYTETTEITLTVSVASDPGYDRCSFRIVDFLASYPDKEGGANPREDQLFSAFGTAAGSFVGNTFVGTWSEAEFSYSSDVWSTGTITVVLNAARDSVLSATVEETLDWGSWTSELSFTGENLPRDPDSYYDLDFAAIHDDPCGHTVDFEYETLIGYPGGPRTMQGYSCSGRTELEFFFWNE